MPGRAEPGDIDTSESLAIGLLRVTAYRVEKNYRRFADSNLKPDHSPSTPEKTREWFAHFLTQQVIIAEARREGYGERIDVCAEVDRMERHMLSQPGGPFYESLVAGKPNSAPDPETLYEKQKDTYDATIVRLPKSSPVAVTISRALIEKPSGDWTQLLTIAKASGQSESIEGLLMWPFEPFEEIASALETASPGPWQQITTNDNIFLYQVRGVRPTPRPPLEGIRPVLLQFARHTAERRLQKERLALIHSTLHFSFDWTAAEQVVRRWREIKPDPMLPLSLATFPDLKAVSLGRFDHNGTERAVSFADYISYHNDLFLRKIPATAMDLYAAVQALVIAQYDCDAARAMGIPSLPKFSEDRENYRNYLALDLYEKERIRPKLNVTDDQIARYYQEHGDEFVHPSRIAGVLVIFDRMEAAQAFAQDPATRETGGQSNQALATESMVLTPETEVAGIPFLPKLVFSQMKTPVLGPFPKNNSFAVWISRQTLESTATPFAQAVPSIRAQLEKSLMEPYETELARTLSRGLKIADRIDYKRYGVTETVTKPWSQ